MYKNGEAVPQDYKTAVKWLKLSAEWGNTKAQNDLEGFIRSDMVFFKTRSTHTCGLTLTHLMGMRMSLRSEMLWQRE